MNFVSRELDKIRQLKRLIWSVLSEKDRSWLYLTIFLQVILAVVDAVGILLVGLLFTVTTTNQFSDFNLIGFNFFESMSLFRVQVWLYIAIIFCLSVRSVGSLSLNRFMLLRLSSIQSRLSASLLTQIQNKDSGFIQRHNIQEISQFLSGSINALFLGVIANTMIVIAESVLLAIYISVFFVVNPFLAAFTGIVFFIFGFLSQRFLGTKSKNYLAKQIEQTVVARDTINDSMLMLDENRISRRKEFFSNKFYRSFLLASDSYAKAVFTNLIPKFLFEIALVMMGLIILFLSALNSSNEQKNFLVIFLAASSRLLPSIMKIQAGLMSIYASLGMSFGIKDFEEELDFGATNSTTSAIPVFQQVSPIRLRSFLLSYINSGFEIHVCPIVIERNRLTFFYGPSGSGKSSIVKALLGLTSMNEMHLQGLGTGKPEIEILNSHFDSVYYLSQKTHLLKGSILTNITLEPEEKTLDMARVEAAIRESGLSDFVNSLPNGVLTEITEVGSNLSGGQLQRLGIARAFYANCSLMVFDEPTSAMDKDTEEFVINSLIEKSNTSTVIVISHQLKFLESSDRSYEVRDGYVLEKIHNVR